MTILAQDIQLVVAPSLTPDSYTQAPAKPAPRLAERGFSFLQIALQNNAIWAALTIFS